MRFEDFAPHLMQLEGGYVNDPRDRGGETNFGISKRAYPNLDIRNLTKEQALQIYKRDYWDAIGADNLPENIRAIAVDAAVNHGVGTARKLIATSGGDPNRLIEGRRAIYNSMPAEQQTAFGNGWNSRLAKVSAFGIQDAELKPYVDAGWGEYITVGKQNGYSAAEIKERLDAQQVALRRGQTKQQDVQTDVARSLAGGTDLDAIAKLTISGFDEHIRVARQNGYTDKEIIERLAPEAAKAGYGARDAADKRGFFGNAWQGAKDRVADIGMAGRQIESRLTGNDAELAQEQAEQRGRDSDLNRIATGSTWGGKIGGFAPDVVAGAATLPLGGPITTTLGRAGLAAAEGAAFGASVPTTEDGQFGTNVAMGAALAPAAYLGAVGAGRAWTKGGQVIDDAVERRKYAIDKPEGQQRLAEHITSMAGNKSSRVDSKWVAETKDVFDKDYAKVYEGVGSTFDDATRMQIDEALASGMVPGDYRRALNKMLYDGKTPQTQPFEQTQWIVRTKPIPVEDVAKLRSAIGRDLSGDGLNALKREQLVKVAEALDNTVQSMLKGAGRAEEFAKIQSRYQHFKAARNMIRPSSDSGVITTDVIKSGITRGRFGKMFEEGKAPYQDVYVALKEMEPTSTVGKIVERVTGHPAVNSALGLSKVSPIVRGIAALTNRVVGSNKSVDEVTRIFANSASREEAAVIAKISDPTQLASVTPQEVEVAQRVLSRWESIQKRIVDTEVGDLEDMNYQPMHRTVGPEEDMNYQPMHGPDNVTRFEEQVNNPSADLVEGLRRYQAQVPEEVAPTPVAPTPVAPVAPTPVAPVQAKTAREAAEMAVKQAEANQVVTLKIGRNEVFFKDVPADPVSTYAEWKSKYSLGGNPGSYELEDGARAAAGENWDKWIKKHIAEERKAG